MELKRFTARDNLSLYNLLIVPYGIETTLNRVGTPIVRALLIVPYGIETLIRNFFSHFHILLIVPYGIETSYNDT